MLYVLLYCLHCGADLHWLTQLNWIETLPHSVPSQVESIASITRLPAINQINRRSWAPVWFNNGQGLPANLVLIRIRMGKVRANNQ